MTLAASQSAFMAQVLDEEATLPGGWGERHSAGLAIYRNNYRSSLVEALRSTFERTERWVGEDAFRRAAAHHVIAHPPSSWTLDEAGRGFDATCGELFVNDPEVAELAWLEWSMLEIFTTRDITPMDGAAFASATAQFAEADWSALRLEFMPGITQRLVHNDLLALWNAANEESFERFDPALEERRNCVVWREGERPVFSLTDPVEGAALAAMQTGASYEDACVILANGTEDDAAIHQAAMQAGAMLGRWLNDGLIARVITSAA